MIQLLLLAIVKEHQFIVLVLHVGALMVLWHYVFITIYN